MGPMAEFDWRAFYDACAAAWGAQTKVRLRVRAYLASPVATSAEEPLTLDGALSWVVAARVAGRSPDDLPWHTRGRVERLRKIELPVAYSEDGWRIAHVSWPIFPADTRAVTRNWRKRARAESYGVPQVMTNGGAYKSLQTPVPCLLATHVDFAVEGDPDRLRRLLTAEGEPPGTPHVTHLGRCRGGGLGDVLGWAITPDPTATPLVSGEGAPMRSIPVADEHEAAILFGASGRYAVRTASIHAPYWRPEGRTLCAVPVPPSAACL